MLARSCELFGAASILLQSFLGLIAVLLLVFKRVKEHPKRPWMVWMFDVSKQLIGALIVHFLNLFVSLIASHNLLVLEDDNACTWYFLNVLFDTTIGVPILWFALWQVYKIADKLRIKDTLSGEYGDPPQWRAFYKQLGLYLVAVILSKLILGLVFYAMPFLNDWAAYLISWTDYNENVQIAFVMFIFPTTMNCVQYYLVDSIIKRPQKLYR